MAQRKKSWCWEYFIDMENSTKIKCIQCEKILSFRTKNTSGMIKHLKMVHDIHSNSDKPAAITTNPLTGVQKEKIDELLVKMICKDLQPLSIVEDDGFRNFVRELNSQYILPTRKTIKLKIIRLHEEKKTKLQQILQSCNVSLSIDFWTSIANDSYLGVTAHCVDGNYQLVNFVIETIKIVDRHTARNIADHLNTLISAWKLNVFAIATDGGANMVAAMPYLNYNVKHIQCCAHILNLIVKKSLNNIPELVEIRTKCKNIVTYFRHSSIAHNTLQNFQEKFSKSQHKLLQDVETRWNSTFYMFQRFIEQKECIAAALISLNSNIPFLTNIEILAIESIIKILQPIEEITVEISGESYVNLSKVLVLRNYLLLVLNNLHFENNTISNIFCKEIINNINMKMSNFDNSTTIQLASILDPRFKLLAFNTDTKKENAKQKLIAVCTTLTNENKENQQQNIGIPSTSSSNSIWKLFDADIRSTSTSRTPIVSSIAEVENYLKLEYLDRSYNPLQFWKTHSATFPHLAQLARKYFSVTATSVPCERLFSKSGILINERRSRLSGKLVDAILFLNKNSEL